MKRNILVGLAVVVLCIGQTGCFRNDIRTVSYSVPAMGSPECVKIIQNAIGSIDGILYATPDLGARTIAVTYDSTKLAIKNIEFVISGAGFDVDNTPGKPQPKAKLPDNCR